MAAKKKSFPKQTGKSRASHAASEETAPSGERLQKILAAAGLGSRRECEELVVSGRVEVNRQVVTELGTRADAAHDEIRVDGVPLRRPRRVYYALNKPPGVVCTNYDRSGRTRAVDLVESNERLFTIGRLDRSSEGLILITNDGDLANRLTHPRYGVEKTYRVEVAGHPTPEELKPLREGVRLAEGVVRVESLSIRRRFGKSTELEVVLTEGINREIRRILAKVGHKVLRLTRVSVGRLTLGEMPTGAYRELSRREIEGLFQEVEGSGKTKRAAPKRQRAAGRPGRAPGGPKKQMEKPRSARPQKPAAPERRVGAVIPYDEETAPAQTPKPKRTPTKKATKKGGGKRFSSGRGGAKGKGKRRP